MMIHPPMLYSGYTLFTIPFAFAIGALITRRLDAEWIRTTRPFALAAWLCLGIGVVLGARWSYSELGWGGYWGWDGVENAALMPWLTGTAFLHSVMIQERRGMLKVWNVSLVLATGILAVLGHVPGPLGHPQLDPRLRGLDARRPVPGPDRRSWSPGRSCSWSRARTELRSEHRLDSLLSREAVFLLNNLVLVALCFVIFWGTFFPLISEAVTGHKASVGPPWFGRYVVPLALVLVLLSGLGPVIAWRRTTAANLRRALLFPAAAALATLVVLLAAGDVAGRPAALAMFCLAAFVLAVVGQEFWRGVRARRAMSSDSVPRRLRRRSCAATAAATAATSSTPASRCCSWASPPRPRSRTRATCGWRRATRARVGGYDITYVRPTGAAGRRRERRAREDRPRRRAAGAARRAASR